MDVRTLSRRTLVALAGLAIAFTALMVLGSAPAFGDQVTCGEIITEDTTLDNDLIDCPGDGIVIGADNITLDLNGHTVAGRFVPPCTNDCVHQDGIDNTGHDRVVIKNGVITSFQNGVRLDRAKRAELSDLLVTHESGFFLAVPGTGLFLSHSDRNRLSHIRVYGGDPAALLSVSDRNRISDSILDGFTSHDAGDGLHLVEGSDKNRVTRSEIYAEVVGTVISDSQRNLIEDNLMGDGNQLLRADGNTIVGNRLYSTRDIPGIGLWESNGNVIRDNTASICDPPGIALGRSDQNLVENNALSRCTVTIMGDQNLVRGNSINGSSNPPYLGGYERDGLRIEAGSTNTLVQANVATGAYDDGIDVEAPGTLVKDNVANDNFDFGIEAVEGVIDGGGNRAFGNGNPLQCLNIVCKP